jgi:hypothetical protein
MKKPTKIAAFPVARWSGLDPTAVASRLIDVYERDGLYARSAEFKRTIQEVRAILEPMRLPADVRRAAIGEWLDAVSRAECQMVERQGGWG